MEDLGLSVGKTAVVLTRAVTFEVDMVEDKLKSLLVEEGVLVDWRGVSVEEGVVEELEVEEGLLDAFEVVEEYLLALVGIAVGKEVLVDGRTRTAESILIRRNEFSLRLEIRKRWPRVRLLIPITMICGEIDQKWVNFQNAPSSLSMNNRLT